MIKVVKFYKPLQLDPGESKSYTVEDEMGTAKFIFLPDLRVYNPQGGFDCRLVIKHIFELGYGDDPLWQGSEEFIVVDEILNPNAFYDYKFTPQLDKATKIVTRHVVTITNQDPVNQRIIKSLIFGLTETQINLGDDSGVITTQQTNV